jgi:four helix bundle protein
MSKDSKSKKYDLEDRTENFARDIRAALRKIKIDAITEPDIKQLVRSSGSVGANYIEANESVSKKDFILRIKYSRKEAKESKRWIQLLIPSCPKSLIEEMCRLEQESQELTNIFGAILKKSGA